MFRKLQVLPAMKSFVLVGGSALALRIQHRKSEDLDFLFTGPQLPRPAIREITAALAPKETVQPFEHLVQREEFERTGFDLDDYQQDYLLSETVKLSFFVLMEEGLSRAIATAPLKGLRSGAIRVASLDSLFLMKVAVLGKRAFTRDLYDLYVLLREHGYTARDLWARPEQAGLSPDRIAYQVRHAKKRADDPGMAGLIDDSPAFEVLQAYLMARFNEAEVQLAEEAARSRQKKGPRFP